MVRRVAAVSVIALAAIACAATVSRAMPQPKAAPADVVHDGEQQHLVEGRVVSRTGQAIAGATVIARAAVLTATVGAKRSFETVSDAEGRFFLDGLPPGTYWFVALHADNSGASPAVPVVGPIEVTVHLIDEPTRA